MTETEQATHQVIAACRSCGSPHLRPVVSLGRTPLANALLTADALERPEPTFPLNLAFCEACSLVQIIETVPPEVLFDDYPYFSSFSDTMVRSVRQLAERLTAERGLTARSLVVEVASNDGYLLQHYKAAGVGVLGIEPAANIAAVAQSRDIPTRAVFFTQDVGRQLAQEGLRADVMHANNVLAHVPGLNGFAAGLAHVLKDDGVAVIEVPYLRDMIDKVEFDTIYHEHLCYFSLTALHALFTRHGLHVTDVERIAIHGGSLRLFLSPGAPERHERVSALLAEETALGMTGLQYYEDFTRRIMTLKAALKSLLSDLKGAGRSVAAYGASAKGSTLLNVFGIGRESIDFIVDRSTVKQGRYTPGVRLPILAPEALLERRPDYVLLLSWNFADEILEQQSAYRAAGGRFIIPVPEPQIV